MVHPENLSGVLYKEFMSELKSNYSTKKNQRQLFIITHKKSNIALKNFNKLIKYEKSTFEDLLNKGKIIKNNQDELLQNFLNEIKMYNKGKRYV
jgi:hypothetical protein